MRPVSSKKNDSSAPFRGGTAPLYESRPSSSKLKLNSNGRGPLPMYAPSLGKKVNNNDGRGNLGLASAIHRVSERSIPTKEREVPINIAASNDEYFEDDFEILESDQTEFGHGNDLQEEFNSLDLDYSNETEVNSEHVPHVEPDHEYEETHVGITDLDQFGFSKGSTDPANDPFKITVLDRPVASRGSTRPQSSMQYLHDSYNKQQRRINSAHKVQERPPSRQRPPPQALHLDPFSLSDRPLSRGVNRASTVQGSGIERNAFR